MAFSFGRCAGMMASTGFFKRMIAVFHFAAFEHRSSVGNAKRKSGKTLSMKFETLETVE